MAEASSLVSKLDRNFLECVICFEPLHDPKSLPCLHAFCCGCLEDWAKSCSNDLSIVSCPLCKKVYKIPKEGVKRFPAHFLVTNLSETVKVERQTKSRTQCCKNHDGEKKRYFCTECGCATCSDCGLLDPAHKGHRFIQLKEAAKKQTDSLQTLLKKCTKKQQKYQVALQQTEQVVQSLERATNEAIDAVDRVENDIVQQLKALVKNQKEDIHNRKRERAREIENIKETLQVKLASIQSAYEQGTEVVNSRSEYEITSLYPSLSANLQQLIQSQPIAADSKLCHLKFEPAKVKITSIGEVKSKEQKTVSKLDQSGVGNQAAKCLSPSGIATITSSTPNIQLCTAKASAQSYSALIGTRHYQHVETNRKTRPSPAKETGRKQWKECGLVKTAPKACRPRGIAIHPSRDIAVTSQWSPATVFSRNGTFKYILKGSDTNASDIAITPSNQYIIPGKNEFHIYDDQGIYLSSTRTFDVNNKPSKPNSFAVDSKGRIIVGSGYAELYRTVSIHQPDGTPISKFATPESLYKIACTSYDQLVISFRDNTLQVMDQSGRNARIIQPPPGIRSWVPMYVCCSREGELFVGNQGNPKAVYRYVSTGGEYKYMDCIATMEWSPNGIALSANEDELFVTSYLGYFIKIYQC